MTNEEKRIELAGQFQYWLDYNHRSHASDGASVSDDMHVIPPNWPTRGVLKEWISILTHNVQIEGLRAFAQSLSNAGLGYDTLRHPLFYIAVAPRK